jgi:hypothetical protein
MVKRGASSETGPIAHELSDGNPPARAPEGLLADLIELEERVRNAIRDAEERATHAIEAAESEIRSRKDAHEGALATALSDLKSRLEHERSTALAEITRSSAEAAQLYFAVDDASVRALAELVARRIAQGELDASDSELREPDP